MCKMQNTREEKKSFVKKMVLAFITWIERKTEKLVKSSALNKETF